MPNIFDAQYWLDEEDAFWVELSGLYLAALFAGIDGGIDTLPIDLQGLVDFDTLNTNALRLAQEYRYDLIKGINDTTRKQVQEATANWIKSGDPLHALETQLTPIFGETRASMIAATETTRIFAEGNALAWKESGFVKEVRFNTVQDDAVCPYCSPLDGQVFDVDDYGHKPPIHVNCRCFNTPVADVESVLSQVEDVLNG